MSILDKVKKNTKAGKGMIETLDKSIYLNEKCNTPTIMPVLNLALSGELDSGIEGGVTIFAGPSKHFKSNLALLCVKSYLDKYPDAACLFLDNEFGINHDYINNMAIDASRLIHIPFDTVENLRNEISAQLDGLVRGDKLILLVDSIGNVASHKEMSDAEDDKAAADMGSRAKALKSLFRVITVKSKIKDIPIVMINQTYSSQGMFPKDVMSGGSSGMYAADSVIFLTRAQEKQGTDIAGYTFTMKVEKGRRVKEASKLKFTALFDKGVLLYSGLLDIALATGHVIKPSVGWYAKASDQSRKYRESEIQESNEFWQDILADEKFQKACKKLFKLETPKDDELEDDIALGDTE